MLEKLLKSKCSSFVELNLRFLKQKNLDFSIFTKAKISNYRDF